MKKTPLPLLATIVVGGVFVVLVLGRLLDRPQAYMERTCTSSLKQSILASLMYSGDYDDRFEKADGWMDALLPYTKSDLIFHDPAGVPKGEYGYAFRELASGLNSYDIKDPAAFIVIFDSSLTGRNAHSELWSVPQPGRHMGGDDVGFADGHVKMIFPKPENPNQTTMVTVFQQDEVSGPMPGKASPKTSKPSKPKTSSQ